MTLAVPAQRRPNSECAESCDFTAHLCTGIIHECYKLLVYPLFKINKYYMDMCAFYKTCIDSGMQDMEIVSKIRLYGAPTNSTADTGVDVLQNYKTDAEGLDHIHRL